MIDEMTKKLALTIRYGTIETRVCIYTSTLHSNIISSISATRCKAVTVVGKNNKNN